MFAKTIRDKVITSHKWLAKNNVDFKMCFKLLFKEANEINQRLYKKYHSSEPLLSSKLKHQFY